jgi:dihydromethanopterin reductase
MVDVRSMCAIGERGQLGLGGRLPWEGDPRPAFREDVRRFWAMTLGHVLIAGPKTIASIPKEEFAYRTIQVIHSADQPEQVLERFAGRVVFVGGGPAVWDVYAPMIVHWDITRLPYDGPADTWFDPKWLVGRGRD